ncbi:hypothetical protein DFJ63DRAFT_311507 [Scheffersomyces coipomensis]|uniref:uncharacterized protein n=1 Tax=Scheffersomyces coipomensis TaxID=1788519 RepID=UPI00315D697D
MGVQLRERYNSFESMSLDFILPTFPSNITPSKVHLEGGITHLHTCLIDNHSFLIKVKDITLAIIVDLYKSKEIELVPELLKLPNIKNVEWYIRTPSGDLLTKQEIKYIIDLMNLENFSQSLSYMKDFKNVIDILPRRCNNMICRGLLRNPFVNFGTFQDLKFLEFNFADISLFVKLPPSLEKIRIIETKFSVSEDFSWPPNVKVVKITKCDMNDENLVRLSGWPTKLKTLTLEHNKFYKLSSMGNLPQSLEYLSIVSSASHLVFYEDPLIRFDLYNFGSYSFPKSLKSLNISGVTFHDFHRYVIEFPQGLQRLRISRGIKSLKQFIFPNSLIYLDLSCNQIESLLDYENRFSLNYWRSLINLQVLILNNNLLDSNSLNNWWPPINLNCINLSSNLIDSLNIKILEYKIRQQISHNSVIDMSSTKINKSSFKSLFRK